jgi:predicted NUDIX family phosphoesterase
MLNKKRNRKIHLKGEIKMTKVNKMDEIILAVKREDLFFDDEPFQGVLLNPERVMAYMEKFEHFWLDRRGDIEEDSRFKQIIPYVMIRRGTEVFKYTRLEAGGEKRLHNQQSIGVGGHMNHISDGMHWADTINENVKRELNEEVNIVNGGNATLEVIGLINDDKGEAGLFHFGVLMVLDLPLEAEVTVKETDQLEGGWVDFIGLTQDPAKFKPLESWSQLAVVGVVRDMRRKIEAGVSL